MALGSRWQSFLRALGIKPRATPALKPVAPRSATQIIDLVHQRARAKQEEIAEGVRTAPTAVAVPQETPESPPLPRTGPLALHHFHMLKGPEYPISSWVVSYALAEHRDTGEIGMIIGLLSGRAGGVPGHAGGVGLGRGKRLGSYKPIKGNTIKDFWYPGLGEDEYESMNAAGSKGEWMDRHIVKQKKTYQDLSTGSWGPKG